MSTIDYDAIPDVVRSIPKGHCVSYGWVACEIGSPRAARAVGQYLSNHSKDLPWWRVTYWDGNIAEPRRSQQVAELRREKVVIHEDRVVEPEVRHTKASDCKSGLARKRVRSLAG